MDADGIEVFVEVVDAQSFSRAAARLGLPATTVSARLARLEARLGVTLIQRTTRRLHVTPAGRSFYAHCVQGLAAIAEGERELAAAIEEPTGLLRVTAPADLAQGLVTPAVERFLRAYPKTSVELVVSNQRMDLLAEGIDLAVRVGHLADSSLIVRKFRTGNVSLWASAAYLETSGVPRVPADLASHALIRFARMPGPVTLRSSAGDTIVIDFAGRLASDDLATLQNLILRGNGIGLLPEFLGVDPAAQSTLVRVLPDYANEIGAVNFVYPAQRFVPRTVRAFIAIAAGEVGQTRHP